MFGTVTIHVVNMTSSFVGTAAAAVIKIKTAHPAVMFTLGIWVWGSITIPIAGATASFVGVCGKSYYKLRLGRCELHR